MNKSVVLLSAGLDSTVNLFQALRTSNVVLALTFDYGQRAAQREQTQAAAIAKFAGVPHKVLPLPWFHEFTKSSLVNRAESVPTKSEVLIDDHGRSLETAKSVWVPNRNGIFLNIAAAFAEGLKAQWIIPGFNREEASTFPDNSEDFLQQSTRAFYFSTANHVEVRCFTTHLDKTEIFRLALDLKVPTDLIWPCYLDGQTPCGECESCQRFLRAKKGAGGDL